MARLSDSFPPLPATGAALIGKNDERGIYVLICEPSDRPGVFNVAVNNNGTINELAEPVRDSVAARELIGGLIKDSTDGAPLVWTVEGEGIK
ncbi:hypothetical protein QP868_02070 [Brevibacterium sp. UMB1308A]|uniref:hypothetical protein n=1 Tax=Brevibacterium sp. UMB1308A TaxID=3050608 RepID=UPI00254EAD37|nr:hypothetical protein [Brevibacterium sp. UMB1308A]MDK8345471.1 hypothetical protein [Brevibacterium sp. UMB1308B]MDK8712684.1 hypothetical protein [Brevibacterium sp. UMB1308A]